MKTVPRRVATRSRGEKSICHAEESDITWEKGCAAPQEGRGRVSECCCARARSERREEEGHALVCIRRDPVQPEAQNENKHKRNDEERSLPDWVFVRHLCAAATRLSPTRSGKAQTNCSSADRRSNVTKLVCSSHPSLPLSQCRSRSTLWTTAARDNSS